MTNIPKELLLKIETASKNEYIESWVSGCDYYEEERNAYVDGSLAIAEQLVKAVEALKFYDRVHDRLKECSGYCPEFSDTATKFLKEYERWRSEK